MSRQFGFIFHFIIVVKVIIASQVCDEVTNSNLNQTFVLGDTRCENNDRLATIILSVSWVLLHVVLFLDSKFPCIMTKRVRLTAPCTMS